MDQTTPTPEPAEAEQLARTVFPDDDGQTGPAEPGDGADLDDDLDGDQ